MKKIPVTWAIIALVVVFALLYSINRGLFVGSAVRSIDGSSSVRICKYVTITGVVEDRKMVILADVDEVRRSTSCTILREK